MRPPPAPQQEGDSSGPVTPTTPTTPTMPITPTTPGAQPGVQTGTFTFTLSFADRFFLGGAQMIFSLCKLICRWCQTSRKSTPVLSSERETTESS